MMADKESDRPKQNPSTGPMTKRPDPWAIEPMPEGLYGSPLDFLFADHHRQRQAVHILLMIAEGAYDKTGVRNLIRFLEEDFALHIQDEESDFVPLLRRHCPPEDGIEELAERLAEEHADDRSSVVKVIETLRKCLEGKRLSEVECAGIRAFASHLRRHLAIENGVLLPIARVRLDPHALDALARGIRQRRNRTG